MRRERSALIWGLYALAWLLFALVQFSAIRSAISLPFPVLLLSTFYVTAPGAVFGLGVCWISARMNVGESRIRLLLRHAGWAVSYTIAWLVAIYLQMVPSLTWHGSWAHLKTFIGYATFNAIMAYVIIASVTHTLRTFTRLREEETRAARAETLRARAELDALRGKLQPHFLFNTLHGITALVRENPELAEQALLKLGDMLRYVLKLKRDEGPDDVALGDEVAFVDQYLALEKIRLGDRLQVEKSFSDEALSCAVPVFTLQPLVENAVQHAVAPRAHGGLVKISGRIDAGLLVLTVSDEGPGALIDQLDSSPGLGLRTVRQRVQTRFPHSSRVKVNTEPGRGFSVEVRIPAEEASEV